MPLLNFLDYRNKNAPTVEIDTADILAVQVLERRPYTSGAAYAREVYLKNRDHLVTVWAIAKKGEVPENIQALDLLGNKPHNAVGRLKQYGSSNLLELERARKFIISADPNDVDDITKLKSLDVFLGRVELTGLFTESARKQNFPQGTRLHHALLQIGNHQTPIAVAHIDGTRLNKFTFA